MPVCKETTYIYTAHSTRTNTCACQCLQAATKTGFLLFGSFVCFTASCKAAFAPHPTTNHGWDVIINCAAETRANQDDAVYKEGIYKLSLNCANEAADQKVKRYVELSSGCVNSSEKTPLKEDCKLEPWTGVAKQKLKVEKELAHIQNLSYTVVRLPVVYGIGDKRYLSELSVADNISLLIMPSYFVL